MDDPRDSTTFLTVEEAAERLGTSRLRVREAVALSLLEARRDNEGRLRVDLPDGGTLTRGDLGELDAEAILAFLFDDIEDLDADLTERDARIDALLELVSRQDAALARADRTVEALQQDKARLAEMLDRALVHLEDSASREARLESLSDRAM